MNASTRSTITRGRALVVVIVIAVLAVLLVGWRGPQEAPITVPANARAGDLVDLHACTYKAGGTEYGADCGTLVVPENRSNPASRLIALPIIRVRALNGASAEPIFFLMGGPGKTNLEFEFPSGLAAERDFVQVGYRGIDGSSVLDCPETVKALKSGDDMLNEALLASFAASIAQCAERLQSEGADLAGYTLVERARDLEAARIALGYGQLELLSESVGTRTAQFYAQLYPEAVHRSVMIAVNPPGHFLWRADVIDRQLGDYAALCAQEAACSARTDDLAETMRAVARDMPDHWLFLPIKPGTVKLGSFFGLFETTGIGMAAPWVFDAWLSAAEGDASGLAMWSLLGDLAWPTSFVWGEMAAVSASTDRPEAVPYLAETDLEGTILGTPGSTWMWGGIERWPANLLPEEFRRVHPSDVETLLVGGTLDFSTPFEQARDELLPVLSRGQQVVLPGFGHSHSVWTTQPEATVQLVNSYYRTGVPDASLFTRPAVRFDPGAIGFPEMMKIAVGVVAAAGLSLAAVAGLVVRQMRRRRASRP